MIHFIVFFSKLRQTIWRVLAFQKLSCKQDGKHYVKRKVIIFL